MLVLSGVVSSFDVTPIQFRDGRHGYTYRVRLSDLGQVFYAQAVTEDDHSLFQCVDGAHELQRGVRYDFYVRVETFMGTDKDTGDTSPRYSLRLMC